MTALHQHLTRRPYVRLVGDSDRRNAALRNRPLPSVVSERAGDGTDVSNLEPRRAEEGLCVFIRPLVSSSGPNFWDWTHAGAVVDSAFGRGVPLGCETGGVSAQRPRPGKHCGRGIWELDLPKGSLDTACRGDDRQTFRYRNGGNYRPYALCGVAARQGDPVRLAILPGRFCFLPPTGPTLANRVPARRLGGHGVRHLLVRRGQPPTHPV